MNLFTKIDRYIDYNNEYSLRKGLETLRQEFERAIKAEKPEYAREVIHTVKMIYNKLHKLYRQSEDWGETMTYGQRRASALMENFIYYMTQKLRDEFGFVPLKESDDAPTQ